MRILHTSDWHLGRSFHRVGLLTAQAAFLDHLVEVVRAEGVDVVLVSGDVYDRALPPVDVVEVLDDALTRLVEAGARVVLTAGNHDSARRLAFGSRLLETARVHIRTEPDRVAEPLLLDDEHGPVAIYPLPYLEPAVAAPVLNARATHPGVISAAMDGVRADLATRRKRGSRIRSVVAAHTFVVGAEVSDSERDIAVGGVSVVPASTFAGVDYVALGHLHRPQAPGDLLRYSGSPLAYSFSERGQVKSTLLVDLGPEGVRSIEPVPTPVPRPLEVLRGNLDELLWRGDLAGQEQAWCQVTLTDPQRPARAMERLRSRFPHTLEIRFDPVDDLGRVVAGDPPAPAVTRDDLQICCDFLGHVRSRDADDLERHWLADALTTVRIRDTEGAAVALRRPEARGGSRGDTRGRGAPGSTGAKRAERDAG